MTSRDNTEPTEVRSAEGSLSSGTSIEELDGWILEETAGQVHVLPNRTKDDHVRDIYCFCKPNIENLSKRLVIHNEEITQ